MSFDVDSRCQGNPGEVKCLENHMHNLETGDAITFREVKGMDAINGTVYTVTGKT